jgi:hypothetical protein
MGDDEWGDFGGEADTQSNFDSHSWVSSSSAFYSSSSSSLLLFTFIPTFFSSSPSSPSFLPSFFPFTPLLLHLISFPTAPCHPSRVLPCIESSVHVRYFEVHPLLCDIDMILIRWILWVYTWLPCVCMCTCGPLLVSWCVVYSVRHVWVFGRSDFHGWHSQLAPGHSKHRSFSARIWVITHHRCPWSRSSWQPH